MKKVNLASACIGYVVGHEDISNNRLLTTSMRCKSDSGSLYVLQASDFIKIMNKDKTSQTNFYEQSNIRDESVKNTIRSAIKAHHKFKNP